MRLFDEQAFELLNKDKRIIIIGAQKGARLIRELLLFRGYETSIFIDISSSGTMNSICSIPVLKVKDIGEIYGDDMFFSSVALPPEIKNEIAGIGLDANDIYDMAQYAGGKIPDYLLEDAIRFLKSQGGEWEHCKSLLISGADILEGGISKCDLIDGLLLIEGWLLPQCNYDTVQVFVNDSWAGNAEVGGERKDIRKKYPVFNDEKCGYSFESVVAPENTTVILVRACKGERAIWESKRRVESVRIEELLVELLQSKEYDRLNKIVTKYLNNVEGDTKVIETLEYYLRSVNDCYEKINIYQIIYQLGFFNAFYMESYVKEIEKVDDIWTKMWLREQDIPWMLFYYPQYAVKSIYMWERMVMVQVAKSLRDEKACGETFNTISNIDNRVAIIVEGLADETVASSIFQLEIANNLAKRAYEVTIFVLDTCYFEKDLKVNSTVKRKRDSRPNRKYHQKKARENVEIWYCGGNSLKERTWAAIEAIIMWRPEFIIDVSLGGTTVAAVLQQDIPVIHIPLTGYSSGAVFDGYIAKSKSLCMKENEIFNSIEESKISEAAINIPYTCKQRKIYYREDFGLKGDDFIMVTVGNRLKYEMGLDFVETVKDTLKRNPRYKWLIVGNDLGVDFDKAVKELIDNRQIILWGYEDDLVALYKICDVYLNPNRMGGCGSMELAMMLQIPIACTDFPSDILPVIKSKNCCGSNYKDIVQYIDKLYANPVFYGLESRKFCALRKRRELSMEHYVDVIIQAYRKRVGK